jgi:hypothetical protein
MLLTGIPHAAPFLPRLPPPQLRDAILGVFRSWNTPRAVAYRRINRITGLLGTAVNVQVGGRRTAWKANLAVCWRSLVDSEGNAGYHP